jgi:hypothetical protein
MSLALNKGGLNSNLPGSKKAQRLSEACPLAAYLLRTDLVTAFLTILVPRSDSRKSVVADWIQDWLRRQKVL